MFSGRIVSAGIGDGCTCELGSWAEHTGWDRLSKQARRSRQEPHLAGLDPFI